jgi:hypothetical protein
LFAGKNDIRKTIRAPRSVEWKLPSQTCEHWSCEAALARIIHVERRRRPQWSSKRLSNKTLLDATEAIVSLQSASLFDFDFFLRELIRFNKERRFSAPPQETP